MSCEHVNPFCASVPIYFNACQYYTEHWNVMGQPFKRESHKMVKHTQVIRRQEPTNRLRVFDHFVGLVLKGWCFSILQKINPFMHNVVKSPNIL